MDRVSLARQLLTDTGLTVAYSDAPLEGHAVENNGKVLLHVRNNSAQAITVTILAGYARSGLKLADRTVTIGAGISAFIGPLDTTTYNQPDSGLVYVDYSTVDGVTVAAMQIP